MITVHHLDNSRSHRILWLLEELGADYEIKPYRRDPETSLAPPDLRDPHPLGKAPIVTDGDQVLAESGAVIEYLLDKFDDGTLRPPAGSPEYQTYRYWLHYAEGTLAGLLLLALIIRRIEESPVPFFLRPVTRGIGRKVRDGYLDATLQSNLQFIEKSLAGRPWLCGEQFTAADVQMSFGLEALATRVGIENASNIAAALQRMHARPAFQRAIERGGPFALPGTADKQ